MSDDPETIDAVTEMYQDIATPLPDVVIGEVTMTEGVLFTKALTAEECRLLFEGKIQVCPPPTKENP